MSGDTMDQTSKISAAAHEAKALRMTTEPVDKLIRSLSVPTIISMLVTSFYNLADTFFVRQLEHDSMVAAVGIALPLMTIIQAIGFYHGHGSGNYISRAFGRQDFQDAATMASSAFVYAFLCGTAIGVLGLVFHENLILLLGAKTEATMLYSADYTRYILIATPFMMGAIVMNNQLRHQGNAFFAMIGLTFGAILNIVLDPLLIFQKGDAVLSGNITVPFGLGMGVAGAALATCISQIVSFCLLMVGVYRSDNVKIRLRSAVFKRYYVEQIARGGLPSLGRQGMASVASACLNHSIGLYLGADGLVDAAQAAMTGVSKIMNLLVSAMTGFGQGFQPVCGFNYGAKKYNRVLDAFIYSLKLGTWVLTAMAILGFTFSRQIANVAAGTSPEALEVAVFTLRTQLIVLPLMGWVTLCNMMLQNIGLTGRAFFLAALRQGFVYAPTVLVLPLLTRAVADSALLGLELTQTVTDFLSFIISLPIGIGVLREIKAKGQAEINSEL